MGEVISQKGDAVYDALIEFMKRETKSDVGNVLEIGAFCGHFTRRLANAFPDSIVFAVDVFDALRDWGTVGNLYLDWLNGKCQFEEYQQNTAGLPHIITIACDSLKLAHLRLLGGLKLSYIDGGHTYGLVKHDFAIAWKHTKQGGLLVFDDYDSDLPEVTQAIDDTVLMLDNCGCEVTKWYLEEFNTFAIRKDRV